MTGIELLRQRQAVRNYTGEEVKLAHIQHLLEAAVTAPNDRIREPWHFYIIQGDSKVRYEQLARTYLAERFPTKPQLVQDSLAVLTTTPLVIVVTSDVIPGDEASSEDNEYAVACAIHSMWIAAQDVGLGMVWRTRGVGLVRDERLLQFIGNPENKRVIGTLFVGYPAGETTQTKRTPIEQKTTWMD